MLNFDTNPTINDILKVIEGVERICLVSGDTTLLDCTPNHNALSFFSEYIIDRIYFFSNDKGGIECEIRIAFVPVKRGKTNA